MILFFCRISCSRKPKSSRNFTNYIPDTKYPGLLRCPFLTICQLFQFFVQARHRHQPRHLLRNNSVDVRHQVRKRRGGAAAPIQEGPGRKLPGTYQHDFYFDDRFTVDTQYFLMMEQNIALFCGSESEHIYRCCFCPEKTQSLFSPPPKGYNYFRT